MVTSMMEYRRWYSIISSMDVLAGVRDRVALCDLVLAPKDLENHRQKLSLVW
jgi:hypothetical protein